jgi:dihydroorotate dehydrogenase
VGVGGIMTPADAAARIPAGASLIQTYSGFIYGGTSFPARLVRGVAACQPPAKPL